MVKDVVFEQVVQYSGPADYKDLYELMWNFFYVAGFIVHETVYSVVKMGQKEDISIIWECKKKINSYVSFNIKVTFLLFGIQDIEVLQNGVKSTIQQGVFKITFDGSVLTGSAAWEKNKYLEIFRRFYDNFFFGRKVQVWSGKKASNPITTAFGQFKQYIVKLSSVCDDAVNECKSFFGVYEM